MKSFLVLAFVIISIVFIQSCVDDPIDKKKDEITNSPFIPIIPEGFSSSDFFKNIPVDNPLTVKGVELGRMLFYDPILSKDGSISCNSCHHLNNSFSDNKKFSLGVNNTPGIINAMPLINLAWSSSFFWDGRATSLEQQAIEPILSVIEMHETSANVIEKLKNHADYPNKFKNAFGGGEITFERLTKALAQFQRTLISGNSRWDVLLNAIKSSETLDSAFLKAGLNQNEIAGFQLFKTEQAECFHCHDTHLGTSNLFEDNGLNENTDGTGHGAVTGNPNDDGKFKVPTLRNIRLTAPYMHDGRFKTLEEVVEFYSSDMKNSKNLNTFLQDDAQGSEGGLGLSPIQQKNLIAFLELFSDTTFVNNPAYKNPF